MFEKRVLVRTTSRCVLVLSQVMKTFRSKFLAIAAALFFASLVTPQATPVKALDIESCQKNLDGQKLGHSWVGGNFYADTDWWRVYPDGKTIHVALEGFTCSKMTPPSVIIFLEKNPSIAFKMKLTTLPQYQTFPLDPGCRESTFSSVPYLWCGTWWYEIDPVASNMPDGAYGFVHGGAIDGDGFVTPFTRSIHSGPENEYMNTYVLKKVPTPPSTSTPPPPPNRPEVLDDQLDARVWNSKSASVHYTVTVRCSPGCGSLPENFAAKLCEVGTKFMSPTCIATTRPFQIGKARKTKLGVVNTFVGTFIVEKKTTGKKYQAYLNIPAGKNQPTTLGQDTFVWNGKSSFKNVPSSITAPTTTAAPGASTTATTIAGTSPTTTSNAASSTALTVTSDSVSGKNSLTVKGSGAAITIDATIKCSGACTKLPTSISGRMCKVGTSYTDASCTSIISLYPTAGSSSTNATFHGNTMFGTSPTGAVYQPYFNMVASGISGRTTLTGSSRVTWTK